MTDYIQLIDALRRNSSEGSLQDDAAVAIEDLADKVRGLSKANEYLRIERLRLREALGMISGSLRCPDNLMGNADIARKALEAKP